MFIDRSPCRQGVSPTDYKDILGISQKHPAVPGPTGSTGAILITNSKEGPFIEGPQGGIYLIVTSSNFGDFRFFSY